MDSHAGCPLLTIHHGNAVADGQTCEPPCDIRLKLMVELYVVEQVLWQHRSCVWQTFSYNVPHELQKWASSHLLAHFLPFQVLFTFAAVLSLYLNMRTLLIKHLKLWASIPYHSPSSCPKLRNSYQQILRYGSGWTHTDTWTHKTNY